MFSLRTMNFLWDDICLNPLTRLYARLTNYSIFIVWNLQCITELGFSVSNVNSYIMLQWTEKWSVRWLNIFVCPRLDYLASSFLLIQFKIKLKTFIFLSDIPVHDLGLFMTRRIYFFSGGGRGSENDFFFSPISNFFDTVRFLPNAITTTYCDKDPRFLNTKTNMKTLFAIETTQWKMFLSLQHITLSFD